MTAFTIKAREGGYRNQQKPCAVPGCTKRRTGITRHCAWHRTAQRKYGHALGRAITKQEYAGYVEMAEVAFERMGADHPALVAAVDIMRTLLDPGHEPIRGKRPTHNPRWMLWRELERLRGTDPKEALAVVVGVWMLSIGRPQDLNDDIRLTYALAQAIFRMRPFEITRSHYDDSTGTVENRGRVPGGLAVGLFGRRVRNALAPFLSNIADALEQEYKARCEKVAQEAALRTPINLNLSEEYSKLVQENAR
jgi:hypothetical protein